MKKFLIFWKSLSDEEKVTIDIILVTAFFAIGFLFFIHNQHLNHL